MVVKNKEDSISRKAVYDAVECMRFASDAERRYASSMLEQIPIAQPNACENTCEIERKSNDMINRADAIDAVKKNTFRLTFAEEQSGEGHVAWSAEAVYSDVMEGALLELPSAQPDQFAEVSKKGDLISRQTAIDVIIGQPPELHYPIWYVEQIKALPSAQPKTGKWILDSEKAVCGDRPYRCSECGYFTWETDYTMYHHRNFCPNCGTRMLKEGEEHV